MNWSDIIGHEAVVNRLRAAIRNKQFPHAAIFSGMSGIGKYTLAKIAAAALLCHDEMNAPCGVCPSCRALTASTHPDYFLVEPDTTNKNPVIKVEQIRQMLRGVVLTPILSDQRVIIINEAHLMNNISQNALLKSIEEPVGRSTFMLITDKRSSIILTVQSRCMTIHFDRLTDEEISRGLMLNATRNDRSIDNVDELAMIADGSLGRALDLIDGSGLELRADVFETIKTLPKFGLDDIFAKSEAISKQPRGYFGDWLVCFQKFLRDMLLVDTDARLYNNDLRRDIQKLSKKYDERRVFVMFSQSLEIQRRLNSNAALQLLCDSFFINLKRSF